MSFLPLTSLVPTVVGLGAFFYENFPHVEWYPYWYLGNPYYYLIGPVVPVALTILTLLRLPLYESYVLLILGSLLIGGFGIYLLLAACGIRISNALIAGVLFVIAPGGLILLFFQDGLHHIAFSFLPLLLVLYKRFLLSKARPWSLVFLSLFLSFLFLITVSILLPFLIAAVALIVAYWKKEHIGDILTQTAFVTLFSLSLATMWYTPGFWLTLLLNPSFGGVPLYRLAWSIFNFFIQLLPLALAIIVVTWRRIRIQAPLLFGMLIFTAFFSLTVIRFISDPDFVIDWIGFLFELQFGIAIIAGSVLDRMAKRKKRAVFSAGLFTIAILLDCYIVINNLTPSNVAGAIYQQKILTMLKDNVPKGDRVFLSGTPVFWVNAYRNQMQIRGGNDGVSVHPFWRHAAFQIREGKDPSVSHDLLLALGTPYVLVHKGDSKEVFRDFKTPSKFDSLYFNIVINGDDALYKINSEQPYGIARVADVRIVKTTEPKKGDDAFAIHNYVSFLKRSASAFFQTPNRLVISSNPAHEEVVSLAITYHPSWRIDKGKGSLRADSLGNIVITPKQSGEQQFVLSFSRRIQDIVVPLLASLVFCFALLYHESVRQFLKRHLFSKLFLGLSENDEE